MCFMCLRDDIFGGKDPSDRQRLRERAAHVKKLIAEAESKKDKMCYVGDAALDLLRQEQYNIARQL